MTAKDEDILTSPALLKKGIAIDRLLQNLVVDNNINPNNLLIGDKNAMLLQQEFQAMAKNILLNFSVIHVEQLRSMNLIYLN